MASTAFWTRLTNALLQLFAIGPGTKPFTPALDRHHHTPRRGVLPDQFENVIDKIIEMDNFQVQHATHARSPATR